MAANKFIAEVDAPEFGEGYTIRLDMHGQGILETEFGVFEFAGKVGLGIGVLSATYLLAFLKVALRGPDGAVVKEVPEIAPPIEPIGRKCQDAFALFRYGKTYEDWVAANENQQPQKAAKANPTKATKA
jgi:hypothetical protein